MDKLSQAMRHGCVRIIPTETLVCQTVGVLLKSQEDVALERKFCTLSFFNTKGIILQTPCKAGDNCKYNNDSVLGEVKSFYKEARSNKGICGIRTPHDNRTCPHWKKLKLYLFHGFNERATFVHPLETHSHFPLMAHTPQTTSEYHFCRG